MTATATRTKATRTGKPATGPADDTTPTLPLTGGPVATVTTPVGDPVTVLGYAPSATVADPVRTRTTGTAGPLLPVQVHYTGYAGHVGLAPYTDLYGRVHPAPQLFAPAGAGAKRGGMVPPLGPLARRHNSTVAARTGAETAGRYSLGGVSAAALCRWLGAQGVTAAPARHALTACGLPVVDDGVPGGLSHATVRTQTGRGKQGDGHLPAVPPALADALLAAAADYTPTLHGRPA